MRLRNIKDAHNIIESSSYLIEKYDNDFKNNNPIEIEIGMGKGNFLINKAILNPNINYIGIERYASILVSVVKKLEKYDLPNLKIMNIDAINIDEYFNKSVSKIYLNFSDPWPKKRHIKRRLTSDQFLNKYENLFENDKVIELKTDNRGFFEYSLINLSKNNYILEEVKLDLYKDLNEDNIQTEYEIKFLNNNLPIYKLKARQIIDKNR